MPTLNTGLIIAGGYSDKVRKTLFAQLAGNVKQGRLKPQEVARAVAELNQTLYKILVEKLGTEKGDVVRVRVDYQVSEEGAIQWRWETLKIEYFKREPEEAVGKACREALTELRKS